MTGTTREERLRLIVEGKGGPEITKLAKDMDGLAKSGEVAEEDIGGFVRELDKLAKIDKSIGALVKLKAGLTETGSSLDKAKTRVAELEKQLSTAGTPTAKLAKDLDRARAAVDNLTKEQNRQRAALDQTSGSLKKAGIDTERLGSAQRQVRQDITNLTDRFGTYATRVREAGSSNERLAKSTGDVAKAAKSANTDLASVEIGLGKIAAAAGAAVAAFKGIQFGGNLVGQAAELQQSLANVQAVSGATAEDFGRLRKAAEDAAASTGISIGAVTEGLAELARTGLDANGVIATLKPTLDLAQAGNIALAQAVEITATTLTQFGLGADQAGRVADVLAQTANATQSSVEGLGRSLTDVAPLAKQLNIPFEETVAILGKLSDEGFKGSRAGTSLRAAFTQLLDPSTKFREELSKLGITTTDFTTVLDELATKGDAGRNAILALGAEAAPAILALAGKGGGAIRALTADLDSAAGSAAQVAAVIRDTLGNAFDRLSATADNAITQLIDPLLKPLQGLLEDVAARVAAFAESEDFDKIRAGLATAFEEGVEVIGQLLDEADFSKLTEDVQTFAATAGKSFASLRGDVESIVAAFEAVAAAVRAMVNIIQVGVSMVQSNLLRMKQAVLELELSSVRLASAFTDVGDEVEQIEAKLASLRTRQAELLAEGQRDWAQVKQAASDFGDAVSRVGGEVEVLATKGSLLKGLAGAFEAVVDGLSSVGDKAVEAGEKIQLMPEILAGTAEQIAAANQKAAKSFEPIVASSERVKRAVVANYDAMRVELEAKAEELALAIARAMESGADTTALQRELAEVEARLKETALKADQARISLADFNATGQQTARTLGQISSSASGASSALQSVAQSGDTALSTIGNKTTQVVGGPLQGLNKAFEEARQRAAALGEEALRAFDATLRVGDQFKGTGFGMRETMDLLARRTQAAIDTAEELERTYANTRDRVRETAEAFAELSRIQSLSLEQQRQANLEAEQAALETAEKKAAAQVAAAAGVERQVNATRELASARDSMPPSRIELVAKNEQKPGGLLSELSEADLRRLAQRVFAEVANDGRGVFGR